MQLNHKKIILYAFILTCTISATASNSIELRLNIPEGKSIKYRSESSQVITQTFGGMNQVVDQSQRVDYTAKVVSNDEDGTLVIEFTYNRIAIEITSNGVVMKFDSGDEVTPSGLNPQFIGFSALVNKSVKIKFSPLGEIIETLDVDEMLESVVNEISTGNEALKPQVKEIIESSLSPEMVKQMFSGMYIVFPEKPLKKGTNWTTTDSLRNQFTMNINNSFTLKEIIKEQAFIEYSSTLTTIPGDKAVMQGMEMYFNLIGTQTGKIWVDTNTGSVLQSSMSQSITGNISTNMGGQNITIPMSINSESKTWVVE